MSILIASYYIAASEKTFASAREAYFAAIRRAEQDFAAAKQKHAEHLTAERVRANIEDALVRASDDYYAALAKQKLAAEQR